MIELLLRNTGLYSAQLAVLAAAAALLLYALKLNAPTRLLCLQLTLLCAVLLPFAQPWRETHVNEAVTFTSTVLTQAAPRAASPFQLSVTWPEAVAGVLLLGIAIRLASLAIGFMRLRRYLYNAQPVAAFEPAQQRLGVSAKIYVSTEIKGPVTFGALRPAVLIPPRWTESESVAYHELLHVRRRDWLFTVAEEFITAILWFHPAVWWLVGQIQLAREELVDRETVHLIQSREPYLEALLAIAEANAGLDLAPASLFLKKRHLRHRVAALLKEVTMSKFRTRSSLSAFVAALALTGWIATRSLPLQAAPVQDAPGVTVEQDQSKLLHRAPVSYPRAAIEKNIAGAVVLELTLNSQGEVADASVLSGPPELRAAALQSVLQWHYDPAQVPSKLQVAIDFTLPRDRGTPRSHANPPVTGTIDRIDLSSLPQPLRDRVASALPVHVGDQVTADTMAAIHEALAFDEHVTVVAVSSDNGVRLEFHVPGESPTRIRVGGNVQSNNLIEKVVPVYPPDAKAARVQGTVRFTATIGKDGRVEDLQLVSGHPLLAAAASDAVKQWVYKPTLLNGNPVEVVTQIDVNFTLSQ